MKLREYQLVIWRTIITMNIDWIRKVFTDSLILPLWYLMDWLIPKCNDMWTFVVHPNPTKINQFCDNPRALFEEIIEIVRACRYVDVAVPQYDMNKMDAWERYHFDMMFVGDDWYKTDKWNSIEESLKQVNVRIVYFPYTKSTSSTLINNTLEKLRNLK